MPANRLKPASAPSRLARTLGTRDAVLIGLGSMIGAGVFAAIGPAAAAAGTGLLLGLLAAAAIAYCNAMSSAQLAALYPESGGAYVYGNRRLGRFWGFLAGWGFVVGKVASCAAMALTFGYYAAPQFAQPLAAGAVVALTAVNYRGIQGTAKVTRIIVAVVLAALATIIVAALFGGQADTGRIWPLEVTSAYGVLQAAGLLFFAFAGYARIATLGEEVIEPEKTIPRAIPIALVITLIVYAAVAISALLAVDVSDLAGSAAPLVLAVSNGELSSLSPVVRIGATVASLGVLLSLLAGVGRTAFSMASNKDLPGFLGAVHPRHKVPHRAEVAVGALVVGIVLIADVRGAIGFSSFAVLTYYGVTNAAALTLDPGERSYSRFFAIVGLAGCAVLAFSLPLASVISGTAVLAVGALLYRFARQYQRESKSTPQK